MVAPPKAILFGCSTLVLTDEEKRFFEKTQPLGFILFARNVESPDQVRALVADLKGCVAHEDVPILIDQEGGRVQRLKPPHWPDYPPAWTFVEQYRADAAQGEQACYLNARLLAQDLADLGINTDCAPVADLRLEGAHDIIGDRAFGTDAAEIAALARAQANGLHDAGVMSVLKHIPGHGRALVDSHEDLPVVDASLEQLRATDFKPFAALHDLPMAMTAHIRYTALDADRPATLSPTVIGVIRKELGFGGLLMTDDLSMKALKGSFAERAQQSLAAGCDVVLHCNGDMAEMQAVAEGAAALSDEAQARVARAFAVIRSPKNDDLAALEA